MLDWLACNELADEVIDVYVTVELSLRLNLK